MIAFALKLLTARAAGPIAASVALALLLAFGCQSVRLAGAQADLTKAEERAADLDDQLGRCQTNRSVLEGSIRDQNAKVEAFAREQSERLAAAEKAASTAAKGRADAEARAAKLLKNQPQGVDACSRFMAADAAVLQSLR